MPRVPSAAGTPVAAGTAAPAAPAAAAPRSPAPSRPPARKTTKRPAKPKPKPEQDKPEQPTTDDNSGQARTPAPSGGGSGVPAVNEIGGFVLAFFALGWVALPFLQGGPQRVKALWLAKFTNKSPDGKWLP